MAAVNMAMDETGEDIFPVVDGTGENEDRILFVGDHAVVDSSVVDMECLSAEFRHRLGLLPDEEQELSELFKSKLGLGIIDEVRLSNLINNQEQTMRQYSLEKFAQNNFQTQKDNRNVEPKFFHQLHQPLLTKDNPMDIQASVYIFVAIVRFMNKDFGSISSSGQKPYIPVTMKVFKVIESYNSGSSQVQSSADGFESAKQGSKSGKSKKRLSIRKILRTIGKSYSKKVGSQSRKSSLTSDQINGSTSPDPQSSAIDWGTPTSYEELLESIHSELELLQFIICHGIFKKELRDEIFCQLCCQVKSNPSKEATERGWILHSMCSACFLPSPQLIGHYIAFLHQMNHSSNGRVEKIMKNLSRANETGLRYQPCNSLELQFEKSNNPILLPVCLVDGRVVEIAADSSCTSVEICNDVARQVGLHDTFGFSLYISAYERVSSMGCGNDHVMDALTECEHMAIDKGEFKEGKPTWKLSYRKELFTPWYDTALDPVSTELIYRQIKDGFVSEELKIPNGIFETTVAQILYVEYGELSLDLVREKLPYNLPKKALQDLKSTDATAKKIYDVAKRLSLDESTQEKAEIRRAFVANAVQFLTSNFSAFFEAFNYGGFQHLEQQEIVVALNSQGVDIVAPDMLTKLAHFDFPDLHTAYSNKAVDLASQILTFIAIDGNEYNLSSPNSEIAANITNAFLNGLRKRSRWAIAVKSFIYKDFRNPEDNTDFGLQLGDTVELLNEFQERQNNETLVDEEFLYGICERTGLTGSFPSDVVYIIPTAHRPTQEFLDMLKAMGQEAAKSAQDDQPDKSRVIMSDADTMRRRPDTSV